LGSTCGGEQIYFGCPHRKCLLSTNSCNMKVNNNYLFTCQLNNANLALTGVGSDN
jgi:hypothetical protein